ncbi:antibiotic biosynthesis monooxygenase [Longispora sp. K20-0274]|uniref:putative quinol monooxygenase n=1 Tax=Longispora sp. K20-0274 TaxID=3088255 RepID=UPI00399A30AE
MYARVVQGTTKPGMMDEFVRLFKDKFGPEIQKTAGFAQSFLTRDGDSFVSMTVFASKADIDADEPKFQVRIGQAAELLTGPPQSSIREVVVHLG